MGPLYSVTKIEGSIPEIAGLATRRGQLVTIINMHAVVCPAGEDTREHPIQLAKSIFLDSAALRKTSGRELENTYSSAIALQVDSINFIQTISATNLSAPGEDARRRHIANLFALDGKMVHILAIEALLAKIYRKGIAA